VIAESPQLAVPAEPPSEPNASIELATANTGYEVMPPVPEPAKPSPVRAVEPPPAPIPPPPPASELPEQIRLYEAARAASGRREFTQGLEHIAELLRRFPSTPLRAEAELTRADLLTRADRLDEAVAAEALAIDNSHRGRRGELLRTIGDLRRKQGDCTRAIDAYARARATTLSATEKARVERGMERCAQPR
jgi:tetratricopeptide (TPR) repeat protein